MLHPATDKFLIPGICREVRTTGAASGKRMADGLECFPSHEYCVSHRDLFETLHIIRDLPGYFSFRSDNQIGRMSCNDDQFHRQEVITLHSMAAGCRNAATFLLFHPARYCASDPGLREERCRTFPPAIERRYGRRPAVLQ